MSLALEPHLGAAICAPAWLKTQLNRDFVSKGSTGIGAGKPKGLGDAVMLMFVSEHLRVHLDALLCAGGTLACCRLLQGRASGSFF